MRLVTHGRVEGGKGGIEVGREIETGRVMVGSVGRIESKMMLTHVGRRNVKNVVSGLRTVVVKLLLLLLWVWVLLGWLLFIRH